MSESSQTRNILKQVAQLSRSGERSVNSEEGPEVGCKSTEKWSTVKGRSTEDWTRPDKDDERMAFATSKKMHHNVTSNA